jgi:hypothetical protein
MMQTFPPFSPLNSLTFSIHTFSFWVEDEEESNHTDPGVFPITSTPSSPYYKIKMNKHYQPAQCSLVSQAELRQTVE